MNRITYLKIKQLIVIICAWLVVGLIMSVYDHFVLLTANSQGPSAEYSFLLSTMSNIGSALIGALFGGSFMVFYVNVHYRDKPYAYTVVAVAISFILIILFIIAVLGVVFIPIRTGKPLTDPISVEALKNFLQDTSRAKNIMIWSLVVATTQLLSQINSKFGPGTFRNIACGKYNTPREENKIFMFLDLNESTTIAERLGDEKYHMFLKSFFADITNPILENQGEIYQYVGDEVVVAWNHGDGIKDNRCVQCFFDIKHQMDEASERYRRGYGLVPSFKASIHCGKVVAGEIGIIKRDITYSGDVLNTASRMLGLCKKYQSEIIASAQLISELCLAEEYVVEPLGFIQLRGKENQVMLSAIGLDPRKKILPKTKHSLEDPMDIKRVNEMLTSYCGT